MVTEEELKTQLDIVLNHHKWQSMWKITRYLNRNHENWRLGPKANQFLSIFQTIKAAADENNPYAIAFLGCLFYNDIYPNDYFSNINFKKRFGKMSEKEKKEKFHNAAVNEAIRHYRDAAENYNNPWGQEWYGRHLYYHSSSPRDPNRKKGFELRQQAANNENPESQYFISECYKNDQGISNHIELSLDLLKSAAAQQFDLAQFTLGLRFQTGKDGVSQREDEARKWFDLAAEQGDPRFLNYMHSGYTEKNLETVVHGDYSSDNFKISNPLRFYKPNNKKLIYKIQSNYVQNKWDELLTNSLTITVSHDIAGKEKIGSETIVTRTIELRNRAINETQEAINAEGCCVCSNLYKTHKKICKKIAESLGKEIADIIREGDRLLVERLKLVEKNEKERKEEGDTTIAWRLGNVIASIPATGTSSATNTSEKPPSYGDTVQADLNSRALNINEIGPLLTKEGESPRAPILNAFTFAQIPNTNTTLPLLGLETAEGTPTRHTFSSTN